MPRIIQWQIVAERIGAGGKKRVQTGISFYFISRPKKKLTGWGRHPVSRWGKNYKL
jgi:hypothetical protein